MARRKVDKQLRLFGVGELGPPDDDDDGIGGAGDSDSERWDKVLRHLGMLLREERFEGYLARRQRGADQTDEQ